MKKHYCIRGCGKTVSRNGKGCKDLMNIKKIKLSDVNRSYYG